MWRLNWQQMIIGCWLLIFSILMVGCASMQESFGNNDTDQTDLKMQQYAEERYSKALQYMEDSRFELAQEQFAVVAATATTPELRALGQDGYVKAGKTIALKR